MLCPVLRAASGREAKNFLPPENAPEEALAIFKEFSDPDHTGQYSYDIEAIGTAAVTHYIGSGQLYNVEDGGLKGPWVKTGDYYLWVYVPPYTSQTKGDSRGDWAIPSGSGEDMGTLHISEAETHITPSNFSMDLFIQHVSAYLTD